MKHIDYDALQRERLIRKKALDFVDQCILESEADFEIMIDEAPREMRNGKVVAVIIAGDLIDYYDPETYQLIETVEKARSKD